MKDYILHAALLKEVEAGNVSASKGERVPELTIFKYTQDCHIEGRWNSVNRHARGIIFHDSGEIIARPFPKFFNLGEISETELSRLPWHEDFEVFEKVDGSCGIGYYYWDSWQLATPGSLQSDQAKRGTEILNSGLYDLSHLPAGCTPVFEIVYPENRIVVDYKGETFLTLLAIFELNGEEWHPSRVDQIAEKCGFRRPRRYGIDIRGEIPFADGEEGYVIRFESGFRIKVKSPAYLRVHRLLNYMSPKGVIELIRGREYGTTLRELPPAIQKDFDDIRGYVQSMHDRLRIEAEDIVARIPAVEDRKTKALWIQANTPNALTGVVFGLMDGKDMGDKFWKLVLEKVRDEKGKQLATE